jgi:hypothetical protein
MVLGCHAAMVLFAGSRFQTSAAQAHARQGTDRSDPGAAAGSSPTTTHTARGAVLSFPKSVATALASAEGGGWQWSELFQREQRVPAMLAQGLDFCRQTQVRLFGNHNYESARAPGTGYGRIDGRRTEWDDLPAPYGRQILVVFQTQPQEIKQGRPRDP